MATVYGGTTGTDVGINPGAARLSYDIARGQLTEAAEILPFRLDRAAVATAPDGKVYAYGGTLPSGADSNLLYMLDPTQPVVNWTLINIVGTRRPSGRKLATLTYMRACNATASGSNEDCLVLVGGDAANSRLGDVWAFYLTRRIWDAPANAQVAPKPGNHRAAAAVASADGGKLYLFGGDVGGASGAVNDMYVLSPAGYDDPDPNTELTNIAVNKPAFGSSTYRIVPANPASWATPNLAVDGRRIQNLITLGTANCYHSNATGTTGTGLPGEFDPWWYVDLGDSKSFDAISIYGRTSQESGPGKYTGFQVWYGNSATPPDRRTSSPPGAGSNTLCPNMPADLAAGDFMTINCPGATGR